MYKSTTQLVLDVDGDNLILPESWQGGYSAQLTPLSEDVEMISGRLVRELRGSVWVLTYEYGYFKTRMKDRLIAACEKGRRTPTTCLFLKPDSGGELSRSRFWVTKFTYPQFAWSKGDPPVPLWGDFSLTLREVKPGD